MASETQTDRDNEAPNHGGGLMRRHLCHPELIGLVDQIVGYSENSGRLHHWVEMAELVVPLVRSFAGGRVVPGGHIFEGRTGFAGAFGTLPVPGPQGTDQLVRRANLHLLQRRLAWITLVQAGHPRTC